MINVNNNAFSKLPETDETILRRSHIKASIHSHRGQMYAVQGKLAEALREAEASHDIRLHDHNGDVDNPSLAKELAWAKHNLAQIYTTWRKWAEAKYWHHEADNVWVQHVQVSTGEPVPFAIKIGSARCLFFCGHLEDAESALQRVMSDIKATNPGEYWAMMA